MEPDCAVSVSDINQLQPLPNMELAGSNLRVKHVERRLHVIAERVYRKMNGKQQ